MPRPSARTKLVLSQAKRFILAWKKDRNGTFLHALSSRGVKKNCPSIILLFFKGFEIPKMAAEVLFEVGAVGRDLGMVRGCHFSNRKTREKKQIIRG